MPHAASPLRCACARWIMCLGTGAVLSAGCNVSSDPNDTGDDTRTLLGSDPQLPPARTQTDEMLLTLDGDGSGGDDADESSLDGIDTDIGNLNQKPSARATGPSIAFPGEVVVLAGETSDDPDEDPLVYAWSQIAGSPAVSLGGANTMSASFVVPHVTTSSTLTFRLLVSDGLASDMATLSVKVVPDVSDALSITAVPTNGPAPLKVRFSGTVLFDVAPEAEVVWDFGDGETANGFQVNHTYQQAGEYQAEVCVHQVSNDGANPICAYIAISATELTADAISAGGGGFGGGIGGGGPPPLDNQVPTAVAQAPSSTVQGGTVVTLDGTASSDPDNAPQALSYQWSQTGGTDVTADPMFDDTTAQPQFTAPAHTGDPNNDTLAFELIVSDGEDDSVPDSVTITVTAAPAGNTAPVAVATTAFADALAGSVVTLDGSGSFDPDGGPQPLVYQWTQTGGGDVTADPLFDSASTTPQFNAPTHTGNPATDERTFELIVSDGDDDSPVAQVTVNVISGTIAAADRTADLPDSWLVLYNINSPDSVTWKDWYIQQWGIPVQHTLGLDVPAGQEKIHIDDMHDDIYWPVVNYLASNPDVEAKVMGILVGYRVPGNYYESANSPLMQQGGGWSVASRLGSLDPVNLGFHRWPPNTFDFVAYSTNTNPTQLTRATLTDDIYLTARIDAPTLADAQALTTRARAISQATGPLPDTDWIYCDYEDIGAPAGDAWTRLQGAVQDADFNLPAGFYPWQLFESEGAGEQATPNAAFRFSYHRVAGWHNADWSGAPAGSRILAFSRNSFGATTVRSTTDDNGRYVPNALFNGGFAAAVGATAEPFASSTPDPSTMLWCLSQGWTMGEAVFRATPDHAWMWELVGDPLLTVPQWFDP